MSFGKRLSDLMYEKNLTQQKLGSLIGVSRQTISQWQNETTKPRGDKIEALAKALGVDSAYLLFGGEPVKAFGKGDETPDEIVEIPEYKLAAAAGDRPNPEWEELREATPAWYRRSFFINRRISPKICRRITVHGDSMEPYICDGDVILFADTEPSLTEIKDGGIYVLSIDGGPRVKHLSFSKSKLIVRSGNPRYVDEIYTGEELNSVHVYGPVLEISRSC